MRDNTVRTSIRRLIPEAVQTTSPAAVVIDRASGGTVKFGSITLAFFVGAGGITFNATNFIALKLEESDDNSAWNVVGAAGNPAVIFNIANQPGVAFAQAPDSNGYVRLINAAKASADADPQWTIGYVGNKRYIRATIVFGGTHGTGTNVALWGVYGHPDILPAA